MVTMYAASSVIQSGSAFARTAMYTVKHCVHVRISFIGFFLNLEISRLGASVRPGDQPATYPMMRVGDLPGQYTATLLS